VRKEAKDNMNIQKNGFPPPKHGKGQSEHISRYLGVKARREKIRLYIITKEGQREASITRNVTSVRLRDKVF